MKITFSTDGALPEVAARNLKNAIHEHVCNLLREANDKQLSARSVQLGKRYAGEAAAYHGLKAWLEAIEVTL